MGVVVLGEEEMLFLQVQWSNSHSLMEQLETVEEEEGVGLVWKALLASLVLLELVAVQEVENMGVVVLGEEEVLVLQMQWSKSQSLMEQLEAVEEEEGVGLVWKALLASLVLLELVAVQEVENMGVVVLGEEEVLVLQMQWSKSQSLMEQLEAVEEEEEGVGLVWKALLASLVFLE
ncbi:unnamed protein product [Parnassius apollo]|uniref:(apollo) hypothetical protein n=1 Tax=Parnassius apollo TaxID=110799 RepID=A0A8S3XGN0_PARAO|nr:unnamed protein product [Parnassius apollo]